MGTRAVDLTAAFDEAVAIWIKHDPVDTSPDRYSGLDQTDECNPVRQAAVLTLNLLLAIAPVKIATTVAGSERIDPTALDRALREAAARVLSMMGLAGAAAKLIDRATADRIGLDAG